MTTPIQLAKNIQKKHGVSYYVSTLLFPKKIQEATFSLYAFVRIIDDHVDTLHVLDNNKKINLLNDLEKEFNDALSNHKNKIKTFIVLFVQTINNYSIPKEYVHAFFNAMRQDCIKSRYDTYKELEEYMYGSATVIGYCMCHIIGHKPSALPYAKKLAEAMQLTNFIRDIKEDLVERGRIYIPKQDMDMFNITENDFVHENNSAQFKELIKFEINRTRTLYNEAWEGINLLDRDGRTAVRCASNLYEEVLNEIEKHEYNVFIKRHKISLLKRFIIIIKTILWNQKKS